MRDRLVVDASAAIAILRAEPAAGRVRDVLSRPGIIELHVPELFWLEVVNVLAVRFGHPAPDIAERILALDELGLLTDSLGRPALLLALDLMARHRLTACDAAYLALAMVLDADLATLDSGLAAAAGDRDVLGSRGGMVSEPRTRYGADSGLAAWAGFGPYLAKLRAESLAGE